MAESCSTHSTYTKFIQYFGWKSWRKGQLGRPMRRLEIQRGKGVKVWIGFIWLRIGTRHWSLLWTFRFYKRWGTSWLAVWLSASHGVKVAAVPTELQHLKPPPPPPRIQVRRIIVPRYPYWLFLLLFQNRAFAFRMPENERNRPRVSQYVMADNCGQSKLQAINNGSK
jgi:hypothetical protein